MGIAAYVFAVLVLWAWWAGHAPWWIAALATVPAILVTLLTIVLAVVAFIEELRKS